MKNFSNIITDMQKDARKINKAFNEEVAKTFEKYLEEESNKWYANNIADTDFYTRTHQLSTNAIYYKKISAFEYKISLNPRKIKKKKWSDPHEGIKGDERYEGIMGSYMDVENGNVAAKVLEWEEEGTGSFAQYGYKKGDGIFGSALKRLIDYVSRAEVSRKVLFSLSTMTSIDIGTDCLFPILKKATLNALQDEYNELYN